MADYLAVNKKDLEKAQTALQKARDVLGDAEAVIATLIGDESAPTTTKRRGRPKGKKNAQKPEPIAEGTTIETVPVVAEHAPPPAAPITQPKAALKAVALPKVQPKAAAKLPKMPGRVA